MPGPGKIASRVGARLLQNVSLDSCVTFEEETCLAAISEIAAFAAFGDPDGEDFPAPTITKESSDNIWLVLTGALVFFMHLGFSMLEAGSVRKKSVVNIMFKNVGTVCVGAIVYWLLGFGFAYGELAGKSNGFAGGAAFAYNFDSTDDDKGAFYFFQFTFAATSATIVSGSVAERITLGSYFICAAFITGFIFPVVTHWVWSGTGFMSAFASGAGELVPGSIGLIDFAGSGVVHVTGGFMALVAAALIGPREGRWTKGDDAFLPSSYTLQTLGTFVLWFGWYGFNCGSTLVIDGTNMSKAAVTTTLAPSAAGVAGIIYSRLVRGKYDLPLVLNCILAGLVSITAGCTAVHDASAIPIGVIGAFVYIGGANLIAKLGIDDPIGASPVHGFAGVWGVLSVGIFLDFDAVADSYGKDDFSRSAQFGMQFVGALLISLWALLWGIIIFGTLKFAKVLRIDSEIEEKGLDVSEHGGAQVVNF